MTPMALPLTPFGSVDIAALEQRGRELNAAHRADLAAKRIAARFQRSAKTTATVRARRLHGVGYMLLDPCAYCGEASQTFDHIEPISRGGRNRIDNLTRACFRCNSAKHTTPALLFLAKRARP